jgi:three-Cys-motif partner protein
LSMCIDDESMLRLTFLVTSMPSSPSNRKRGAHRFGGDWTTAKLDVLKEYLVGYTTALQGKPSKERPFVKAYIDAFAGTGYRDTRRGEQLESPDQGLPFPDLADEEPQAWLDGSARLALKVKPRFDCYIFIERNVARCAQLELLKSEFPHLAEDVQIRQAEANAEIQRLCQKDWRSHRAVLFLDPYGMQVEWATIEAVAATKAIDLWLLFPLGIGVTRLLKRSGEIPSAWRRRLNVLLGTENWYDEFYSVERRYGLFDETERVIKASTETIGWYFNNRLKSVFTAVAEQPKVLRNSANCPLYLLCFAVGNENGAPIALRIANHLLTKGQEPWRRDPALNGPSRPGTP